MFHLADGWFFDRRPDGGVHIIKRSVANEQAPIVNEAIIGADSWASIVTAVSKPGSDQATVYQAAKDLHAGRVGAPDSAPSERETPSSDKGWRRGRGRKPADD